MMDALRQIRLLALLALTLATGCASAYHSYRGCRVPCQYCAPPPLPYSCYRECVCHSIPASRYLAVSLPVVEQDSAAADPDGKEH